MVLFRLFWVNTIMSPKASAQLSCETSITNLYITSGYVIATTVPGTILILDINCTHTNLEDDPHKRIIEAGELWATDWYKESLVTGNADGTARLWNIRTG